MRQVPEASPLASNRQVQRRKAFGFCPAHPRRCRTGAAKPGSAEIHERADPTATQRLQSTVEGLSVAAITYYVVSLFGYLAKAVRDSGRLAIEPSIAIAAFVPAAALAIWWTIRRKHIMGED
jgi:Protein of unknown function (DUF3422)